MARNGTIVRRIMILMLVTAALMVLVDWSDGQWRAAARHFLRNLLRYLF
jgi:hypothetical protein